MALALPGIRVCARPPSSWFRLAERIGRLAGEFSDSPLDELRTESLSLRYQMLSGQSAEHLLPRAFALVCEVADRKLGLRHYPVQVVGGIAMHHGCITEMQTGEGKTLTALLPMYLAAIGNRGAHLATANDYLAGRDAELMGPVYESLGLSVGCVQSSSSRIERKRAYACNVTYTTAKEIGFDFLRDRLAARQQNDQRGVEFARLAGQLDDDETGAVLRELHFALIDEADSILIDEARTPLIISSLPGDESQSRALYLWAAETAERFNESTHYQLDPATRAIRLTHYGRMHLRKCPKPDALRRVPITNMYEQLELAIQAREQFVRDRHYVIKNDEVVIVDEFTGRMAEGRKWRAGIHQAIEAKEKLPITPETRESARVTIQDLFLRYKRVAGMTGTIAHSGRELVRIYKTPVSIVPTHRTPQRKRLPDRVFESSMEKWQAIVDEIVELHHARRPVLVGTRSIDKSETLAERLAASGIKHRVLNARHLAREAEIVAQAGIAGSVTVATNMAGRGTDIQLCEIARQAGGLHVIISELHESARIDRQLIGRCGRQGDPGSYRFYMSLDDDILSTGLGAKTANRLQKRYSGYSGCDSLAGVFRHAQRCVEKKHFHSRRMLLFHERQREMVQREMGHDPYLDTFV